MLFNSLQYGIFLPIVFILYWALPHKFRWILMLISSYWFYMSWNPKYVVLILFTTIVSYFSALIMERQDQKKKKKRTLIVSLILCLGVLFFFKYFNFASETVTRLLSCFTIQFSPIVLSFVLPVGISFYTFQTLSYAVDVYKGEVKAERHFGYYATFVSFFPQLVAGPIERTNNLLPQIKAEHHFDYDLSTYGLKQMAWGFFKKIVIADQIAVIVGPVFDNPKGYDGLPLLISAVLFSFQIYCDFSGYSDIAIGTAKLFGIKLMKNFDSPYFSQSIREFWGRWHISLSTWFRDYVYIPLGGNRVGKIKSSINIFITFLLSGLWHGANWTFVIWGGIHGFARMLEGLFAKKNKQRNNWLLWSLRVIIVFAFTSLAWIFFASPSTNDALYILSHIFSGAGNIREYLHTGKHFILGAGSLNVLILAVSILLLAAFDYISLKSDTIELVSSKKAPIRWGVYLILTLLVVLSISYSTNTEFIYFQF